MAVIVLVLVLTFNSCAVGSNLVNDFDKVMTLLSTSNDLETKSIKILSVENELENDYSGYYSIIRNSAYMRKNVVSYFYVDKPSANFSILIQRSTPVLTIVFVGKSTKPFHELMMSTETIQFEENQWLFIPNSGAKFEEFIIELSNLLDLNGKLSLISQIYILEIDNSNFRLFELYKPCEDRKPQISLIIDTLHKKISNSQNEFIWQRRKDLSGCQVKISYINSNTFYEKSLSNQYDNRRGYSIKLGAKVFHGIKKPFLEYLLSTLNFSAIPAYADDNSYGTQCESTGEWSGIIGVLSRNEADIGGNWLTITSSRSKVIKYSLPFINVEYKLFMKKPEPVPNWNTFLHVFDYNYWITLTIAVLFCIICLCLVSIIPCFSSSDNRLFACIYTIQSSIALTCRAMVTYDIEDIQGTPKSTRTSKHLVVFIICSFGMANYYIYNGGIISTLMVKNYKMPIRKLEDFLKKPEYQLLFKKGGSTEQYFSSSSEEYLRQLWEKVNEDNSFITNSDEAEKVIKTDPTKILFYPLDTFKYLYDSFPCEIIASDTSYNQQQWAFGFNKKSTYIKLFNYHISKGMELGLEVYANQKETQCATIIEKTFRPVNFEDIFPAFVVASVGCVIAIVLCVAEFIRTRMRRK